MQLVDDGSGNALLQIDADAPAGATYGWVTAITFDGISGFRTA